MGGRALRTIAAAIFAALAVAPLASAQNTPAARQETSGGPIALPPMAQTAIHQIYAGDPAAAIRAAQILEGRDPSDPLGYLVEGEARWWKLYCEQNQYRYGMVDIWSLPKRPEEQPYLAAAQKVVTLAQAQLARKETALAHLWAGMGYALEARLYGLRGEKMATARTGVKAREELLRAIELDPRLVDADTGLGLYNYYVSTLSPIVKLLRFFLGIPGGSKQEGVRQLESAMNQGQVTSVEARFYLAKNLRTYDQKYAQALEVAQPLVREYPDNPIFLLLVANLEIELGRRQQAAETLARINRLKIPDAACAARSESLARELLSASH